MPAVRIEVSSRLAAPRSEVWARVSTMSGVNDELLPLVRMTYPGPRSASLAGLAFMPGEVLFRSWVLAFGFLPFDRHALSLCTVTDGVGFVEESTSWLQRRWRHERQLDDLPDGGCTVTDRLIVEPRLGAASRLTRALVQRIFTHRHHRLRARFGQQP